jgi:hypothetical protein
MKHRFFAFLLVLALSFGLVSSASAQEYSFQLTRETVKVFVNTDGTLTIDYIFEFYNNPGAHAIDFVDVGVPNSNYSLSNISADVDGAPVDISTDYQGRGTGFAVDLGSRAIQPRASGAVHVNIHRVERMLYPDDNDETLASMEFSPTWFGSQYVTGSTDLKVTIVLPPGVKPEQPRYHPARGGWPCETAPEAALDDKERVTYTWRCPTANGYSQYTFGASFPASTVPEDAIVRLTFIDTVFGAIGFVFGLVANFLPFCCFAGFFFGIPILGAVQERKRKMQYLPPKISIEGHGIKRGLTAVEAAILMSQPLDKVMTMILFGVVKKGAVQVEKRDPLELAFATEMPENLREYEKEFMNAFRLPNGVERRRSLQTMTVNLVKSVGEKMKGFSGRETIEYYKAINEKAWKQLEAAGTPEIKSQMFEEAVEWTMLDKDYDDRSRRVFTGPIFVPTWWHRYDPVYRGSMSTPGSAPVSTGFPGSGRSSLPGADFAASVITSTQTFAQKVLGGTETFTQGITKVTNPPPVVRSSGGRSGGGCACACACAGCACACAGGGR